MVKGILIIIGVFLLFPLIVSIICLAIDMSIDMRETLLEKRKIRWLKRNGFKYGYVETSETTGRKFYGWKNLMDGRLILEWELNKLSYKEILKKYDISN